MYSLVTWCACIAVASVSGGGGGGEDVLAAISGARATVCISASAPEPLAGAGWGEGGAGAACGGVLWQGGFLLARASCLAGLPLQYARVLRLSDGLSCSDVEDGRGERVSRGVRYVFVHPAYSSEAAAGGAADAALAALDRPFRDPRPAAAAPHALLNASAGLADRVARLVPWLEEIAHNHKQLMRSPREVRSSPLSLFVWSVLLPGAASLLLYLYLIFCSAPAPAPGHTPPV